MTVIFWTKNNENFIQQEMQCQSKVKFIHLGLKMQIENGVFQNRLGGQTEMWGCAHKPTMFA